MTGAAFAAVVSFVLVGVGVGVGTAQEDVAQEGVVQDVTGSLRSVESGGVRSPAAAPVPPPEVAEPALSVPALAVPSEPAPSQPAPSQPEPATESGGAAAPEAPATRSGESAESSRVSVPARSDAASALVAGTPCTVTAKACVDLAGLRAWLIEDGVVRRGPVSIMVGDEIDPTPLGTFQVEWKAEAWTSREYLTQMPYSVFFAEGGIAFHEGSQETNSAGCVKLTHDHAMAWFQYLQVGDEVQVR